MASMKPHPTLHIDIGKRLKDCRMKLGLSQRALAKKAGVTNGLISQIEQNSISPSIASLKKILDVLSMSLADFFTADDGGAPAFFYERKRLPDLGSGDVAIYLVGAGIRHRAMSVLHEVYPPGADTGPQMLSHAGEEGGVVMKGRIEITVGDAVKVLGPGDAYYFESRLRHRFRNVGRVPCEIVSANSPPTF
jgi:transcriptional regulator with XRE-family HTH domain